MVFLCVMIIVKNLKRSFIEQDVFDVLLIWSKCKHHFVVCNESWWMLEILSMTFFIIEVPLFYSTDLNKLQQMKFWSDNLYPLVLHSDKGRRWIELAVISICLLPGGRYPLMLRLIKLIQKNHSYELIH